MQERLQTKLVLLSKFNNEYQIKYLCDGNFSAYNLHNALIWLSDARLASASIPDKVKQDIRKHIADYLLLLDGYDMKLKRHTPEVQAA